MQVIVISKKSHGISRSSCNCGWNQICSNGAIAEAAGIRHRVKHASFSIQTFIDGVLQVDPVRRAVPGRFGGNPNTGSGMIDDATPYQVSSEVA